MKKNVVVNLIALFVVCFFMTTHVNAQGDAKMPDAKSDVDFSSIIGEYSGNLSNTEVDISEGDKVFLLKDDKGKMVVRIENVSAFRMPDGNFDLPIETLEFVDEQYQFASGYINVSLMEGKIESRTKLVGIVEGSEIFFTISFYNGGGKITKKRRASMRFTFSGKSANTSIYDVAVDNVKIRVSNKTVSVDGFSGLLQVFSTMGTLIYGQSVEDSTSFPLEKGIYILKLGNKTNKILVE